VSLVGSGATWHSTALSYGVIPVAESDVEPLTRFVKEYERIRKIEDERERRVEEVEWIVRLVEFPLLSWEGAFELNAGRYLPVGSSTWETYARDLTPEQWERLTVVLLGSTELTGDLLELVRDRRDPRVLAWYLDRIAASAEDPPWNLEDHLHWFSGILPDQELKTSVAIGRGSSAGSAARTRRKPPRSAPSSCARVQRCCHPDQRRPKLRIAM
jgi:hypothetical protein